VALSREQLEQLYRRHAPDAFRRARGLLANDADAHEVVHDLFLSLWERPEQFAGKSSMTTFLYSAVTHACLNRIRNLGNRARLVREQSTTGALAPAAGRAGSLEDDVSLRHALSRMPEPLAQVAVYYYFDDLSHEEIARILGCSRRHVGDLLGRLANWVEHEERIVCAT
jgi:RNA polymerase sigma-70 factor, ECF subfamily